MQILYLLESIRNPALNAIMSIVTMLGEETVIIVLAVLVFWCYNKKDGYYLIAVGFFGMLINQFLKVLFKIPRPWVIDENFTIVESAREQATGYSFPSGHTSAATTIFVLSLIPSRLSNKRWVKYLVLGLCCLYVLTMGLSRICVKAHYASDVLFGFGITSICFLVTYIIFKKKGWLYARGNKC